MKHVALPLAVLDSGPQPYRVHRQWADVAVARYLDHLHRRAQ